VTKPAPSLQDVAARRTGRNWFLSEDLTRLRRRVESVRARHYSQEVSVMNEATPTANVAPAEQMKQLVLEIVRALVDQPDDVVVELIQDRDATVIQLRVAHQDIGKVIGKQGRTARSLRTILGAASMKLHHRFSLDILEDDQPRNE
jgi:predicted RNA-binding protein YlqC (UPF0109 family)